MTIDLTDAAKALELEDPPEIEYMPSADYDPSDAAAFVPKENVIKLAPEQVISVLAGSDPDPDSRAFRMRVSLESRGLTTLEHVMAHELYHARQMQDAGSAERLLMAYSEASFWNFLGKHEDNPFEYEADAWARANAHLVKITE